MLSFPYFQFMACIYTHILINKSKFSSYQIFMVLERVAQILQEKTLKCRRNHGGDDTIKSRTKDDDTHVDTNSLYYIHASEYTRRMHVNDILTDETNGD